MNCHCGCGEEARKRFRPGHDQKVRARLEKRVGGLSTLEELVDSCHGFAKGTFSQEQLTSTIYKLFPRATPGAPSSARSD